MKRDKTNLVHRDRTEVLLNACAGRQSVTLRTHLHPWKQSQVHAPVQALAAGSVIASAVLWVQSSRHPSLQLVLHGVELLAKSQVLALHRFVIIPDMLKNAPMFKRIDPKMKVRNVPVACRRHVQLGRLWWQRMRMLMHSAVFAEGA